MARTTYVIGHKHSDMDAVASAYAYAQFLRLQGNTQVIAARHGELKPEIRFVLERFHVEPPLVLEQVYLQVRDVMSQEVIAVHRTQSLLEVAQLLQQHSPRPLPVVDNEHKVRGIITQKEFANLFLQELHDDLDPGVETGVALQRENLVRVLKGRVLVEGRRELGKRVLVAAMEPDTLRSSVEAGSVVVIGDLQEAQRIALAGGAAALVITGGAPVAQDTLAQAQEQGVMVLTTPYQTFTAVRLMSMSVRAQDFMNRQFLSCHTDDEIDEIRPTLLQHGTMPVVDQEGRLIGELSRTDLMQARPKQVILVDHNERSQAVDGIEEAELLGVIDHHRVADVQTTRPILFRVEPLGSTSTIIAILYQEAGLPLPRAVAGVLLAGLLTDTLILRSPTCTQRDRQIAAALSQLAGEDIEDYGQAIFAAAASELSQVPAEELLTRDFKEFRAGEMTFAIGTIEVANPIVIEQRLPELLATMHRLAQAQGYTSFLFMIVDILKMRCHLLIVGAEAVVADVLGVPLQADGQTTIVEGLVSRKKQLVPLLPCIQEELANTAHK